jgi:hypothetical protein
MTDNLIRNHLSYGTGCGYVTYVHKDLHVACLKPGTFTMHLRKSEDITAKDLLCAL